ncbi:hypothetical protein PR202_gb05564 [Eleusine coracana subsp. coracana]|uniref:Uncharacterized protein n=1 Tax=Eleusine coracana subsp. coracana TaxID=191504 RepID=A0AAV5E4T3_ELECO|nr:hypothetical protein PR202_gb05564 [Eleusine coracana subsp. coracana]
MPPVLRRHCAALLPAPPCRPTAPAVPLGPHPSSSAWLARPRGTMSCSPVPPGSGSPVSSATADSAGDVSENLLSSIEAQRIVPRIMAAGQSSAIGGRSGESRAGRRGDGARKKQGEGGAGGGGWRAGAGRGDKRRRTGQGEKRGGGGAGGGRQARRATSAGGR